MDRSNYFFNKKTCSYEQARLSFARIVTNIFGILLLTVISGVSSFVVYNKYCDNPIETRLRRENDTLRNQYILIQDEMQKASVVLKELEDQDEMIYRTILEANPIRRSNPINYASVTIDNLLVQCTFDKLNDIKQKIITQTNSYREILALAKKREQYLSSIPAIQPISNKTLKRISGGYGMRYHPIHKVHKLHRGIDYVAKLGTNIYATGDGIIKKTSYSKGYGNLVEISHGNKTTTRYAHLHAFNKISVGQKVVRGQCIGYVGSTGTATGPHLHYEIIRNKKHVNPTNFFFGELNASQYDAVLEVASRKTRSIA